MCSLHLRCFLQLLVFAYFFKKYAGRHVIFLILYIYKIEIRNSEIYLPEASVSSTMAGHKRCHHARVEKVITSGRYISVNTAKFIIWIPKSLVLLSEWENIKEWNKYPWAILNMHRRGGQKNEFILVLFKFPTRLFITSCYLPKCIILTVILFFIHGVATMPDVACGAAASLTRPALFTYYLANHRMVYYLLNSIFKLI